MIRGVSDHKDRFDTGRGLRMPSPMRSILQHVYWMRLSRKLRQYVCTICTFACSHSEDATILLWRLQLFLLGSSKQPPSDVPHNCIRLIRIHLFCLFFFKRPSKMESSGSIGAEGAALRVYWRSYGRNPRSMERKSRRSTVPFLGHLSRPC